MKRIVNLHRHCRREDLHTRAIADLLISEIMKAHITVKGVNVYYEKIEFFEKTS